MAAEEKKKSGVLRGILRTMGLSPQAADDVINFINDLLGSEKADKSNAPQFPYHLRDHFLSEAEFSFFKVLENALGESATICTKVRLADIFYVKPDDNSTYRTYTNKIDRKHVDFLVCDPVTMKPLVALELDDKSHQRKDRQKRDELVDQVFKAAGLPLVHVPARRTYSVDKIAEALRPYIDKEPSKSTPIVELETGAEADAMNCPKCGSDMVLRTAKKGKNAGNQFWGCSAYPHCKTVIPADRDSIPGLLQSH